MLQILPSPKFQQNSTQYFKRTNVIKTNQYTITMPEISRFYGIITQNVLQTKRARTSTYSRHIR